ncbi:MAG: hypothetical protein WCP98_07110 [Actinomycetes bacterium]
MSHPRCAGLVVVAVLLVVVAAVGCGQSWTKVAELAGGTTASGTSSRTTDFQVDGTVRTTYHTSGGSGTIVAYLMPSDAPDDLEGRVDSGKQFLLGGEDGESAMLEDLHGSYYVTATGMFEPWSLTIEVAK